MQRVLKVSGTTPEQHDEGIVRAAQVLREGGLALIPTETVYGLGVAVAPLAQDLVDAVKERDACRNGQESLPSEEDERPSVNGAPVPPSGSGYRRIFSVKHRELTQTVPWLVGGVDALDRYGYGIDPITRALAEAFWPGALTLIVHARESVPVYMQAADGTVALRCSASPVVAALIKACGCPLATTSANTHGAPAPVTFGDVEPSVLDGVDVALDAGETPCRDASTIVSCIGGEPVIIRQGAISRAAIARVVTATRNSMAQEK